MSDYRDLTKNEQEAVAIMQAELYQHVKMFTVLKLKEINADIHGPRPELVAMATVGAIEHVLADVVEATVEQMLDEGLESAHEDRYQAIQDDLHRGVGDILRAHLPEDMSIRDGKATIDLESRTATVEPKDDCCHFGYGCRHPEDPIEPAGDGFPHQN